MSKIKPRIAPLPEADWTAEQRAMAEPTASRYGMVFNVLRTLMRNMPLLTSWNALAGHLMTRSSLSPRERELLIMRVAWQTQSDYEWGQHVLMSKAAGLTAADHERIKAGPDSAGWEPLEAAMLTAVDELLESTQMSDATWSTLAAQLNEMQLTDLIFTVGQYNMLAMALKTLRVERDAGVPGF